jgi:tetratricopeptide (TPR) repeat protein
MARPARLLGFAVLSALLVPATQFASSWQPLRAARGEEAQTTEWLRGLGDRFLNGSGTNHTITHQEPVPLGATQSPEFFDARDLTQIPGFFGESDSPPLVATQETGDLDLLSWARSQVEPLPPLAEPTQILAQANSRSSEAERFFQQGLEQFRRGQFRDALASWEQALELYRAAGDLAGEGLTLGHLGIVYADLSQYERAIDLHEESLAIAREIGDLTGEGAALNNLGIAYENWGQYERAISLYEQALAIAREIQHRAGESHTLGNLGNTYKRLGQYERAIDFLEQQLAITREIGDRAGEGRALGNLGIVYSNLSHYQRAIDLYKQALDVAREMGNIAQEGTILSNLGNAYAARVSARKL